jgi:hypothetical protein
MVGGGAHRHPWQSVVSQLLYSVGLNSTLDDELAQQLAAMMIRRQGLTDGPEVYHRGLSQAVEQEDILAGQTLPNRHSPEALREFFRLIVRHLEAGRPWPPPRWERLPTAEWPRAEAPTVATIWGSLPFLTEKFQNFPDEVTDGGEVTHAMVLRLRTGEVVALELVDGPTPAQDRIRVKVLDGDPAAALTSLIDLAKIRPEHIVRQEDIR